MTKSRIVIDPDESQRGASDPSASVWVAASAGTGKTKVLIDRVLRLLLDNVEPDRILCLTFTKAAAAEMRIRIMTDLRHWSTMDDAAWAHPDFVRRLGRLPTAEQKQRGKSLFAHALDVAGGLKIQTIHAFCESLLGRFPIEAGVTPNFSGIDEIQANAFRTQAVNSVLNAAATDHSILHDAVTIVTQHLDETRFQQILREATPPDAMWLDADNIQRTLAEKNRILRQRLNIGDTVTQHQAIEDMCRDEAFDAAGLRRAAQALAEGSKTDMERSEAIAAWLEATPHTRISMIESYRKRFVTKENRPQANLITKKPRLAFPGVEEILIEEANRLCSAWEHERAVVTAETTHALLILSSHVNAAYQQIKNAHAVLDYDDLIQRAITLLEAHSAAWVLYKLDGGIDHLLVDEAQDTSPQQWRIIRALTGDFFVGHGARERQRSVFFVGDLKQSIYRFQGADPDVFKENQDAFARAVKSCGEIWRPIELDLSFRSTRAVLAVVDHVFARSEARDGVALDDEDIVHRAHRLNDGGSVELWPLVEPKGTDEPEPWQPPTVSASATSPQVRLAQDLATHIRSILDKKVPLASEDRPIKAGDIMVLVQRRTSGFMADLIHALKRQNVPVAGEDRMILNRQIAVMDLMALSEFCLLPEDDLVLATVLKTPLIGFDEDQLFSLAHPRGRKQSLWSALRERARTNEDCASATAFLMEALRLADAVSPFDFFAHILGPMQGRKRLLMRLGREADDPINEFLARALAFEQTEVPSLQGFLRWLVNGAIEIKRDQEQDTIDAVRVLTVHGAKGLQAPIVFLPDTVRVPRKGTASVYWEKSENGRVGIWRLGKENKPAVATEIIENEHSEVLREYRRLLYVAMTRARDHLVVCGWKTKSDYAAESWYHLIRSAMTDLSKPVEVQEGLRREEEYYPGPGSPDGRKSIIRISCPQNEPAKQGPREANVVAAAGLPQWALSKPPKEQQTPSSLAPSRTMENRQPISSPLDNEHHIRFARGRMIHTLLQHLPGTPPENRLTAARSWFERHHETTNGTEIENMITEVVNVIKDPEFARFFGPESQAEAPISGILDGQLITGRIDRLVIAKSTIDILDYKTDTSPPLNAEAVPIKYIRQMALYRDLVSRIYPDHQMRVHLLWTDGPRIMHLPDTILARYSA